MTGKNNPGVKTAAPHKGTMGDSQAQPSPVPAPGSTHKAKHVPTRMCVVCREKGGKRTLTRVVRTPDGIQVDVSGKMNGRGAYLCEQAICWDKAVTTEILGKALKMTLSADDRERLKQAKQTS